MEKLHQEKLSCTLCKKETSWQCELRICILLIRLQSALTTSNPQCTSIRGGMISIRLYFQVARWWYPPLFTARMFGLFGRSAFGIISRPQHWSFVHMLVVPRLLAFLQERLHFATVSSFTAPRAKNEDSGSPFRERSLWFWVSTLHFGIWTLG